MSPETRCPSCGGTQDTGHNKSCAIFDDAKGAFSDVRAGCCDTWPKPCTYHEGFIDGHMARDDEIERLRVVVDAWWKWANDPLRTNGPERVGIERAKTMLKASIEAEGLAPLTKGGTDGTKRAAT